MNPLPAIRTRWRKLGSRLKLNLVLLGAGLVFFGAAVWSFDQRFTATALAETTREAEINMRSALAVRAFISSEVTPLFAREMHGDGLWPPSVPAYAAQRTMSMVYADYGTGYSYREAALSPLNRANRAIDWEAALIERYRNGSIDGEHAELQHRMSGDVIAVSRPIKVGKADCLLCYGTPEAAPEAIRQTYGTDSGFHWKLGEIVGAQIVEVPAGVPIARASAALHELLWFLSGFFLILFVALNWLLNGFIIGPLDKANAQLNEMAWRDPLTGSANRRGFMRRLDADLQLGASVSVLMLDLDHFKAVNDRHGHAAGDRVLVEVGRLLARCTRASDHVGRLGGEEFAVVLPQTAAPDAVAVAEGLRDAIARHAIEGVGHVTASFGCAEWDGAEPPSAWLARADFALYEAKRRGRNRVVNHGDAVDDTEPNTDPRAKVQTRVQTIVAQNDPQKKTHPPERVGFEVLR